jgi:hypothetical protein
LKRVYASAKILDELERHKNNKKNEDVVMKQSKASIYTRKLEDRKIIQYIGVETIPDINEFILSKNLNPKSDDDIIICHYLYYLEKGYKLDGGVFAKKPHMVYFSDDRIASSRAYSRGLEVAKLYGEEIS